jgi:hypothetical protein
MFMMFLLDWVKFVPYSSLVTTFVYCFLVHECLLKFLVIHSWLTDYYLCYSKATNS